MTYTSISEGELAEGDWTLNVEEKKISLTNPEEEGALTFIINELTTDKLILLIDDPTDKDAKNLKIIFESK